jgi:MinD-like ATPase involved in chromosome partitioning or flagellar assembly
VFCSTFYSFKGGVGRTLALANVAVTLARRGKRVLVVDLDLEAPGLTTLDVFANAEGKPGFLDFVQQYLTEGRVSHASAFIHTCEIHNPQSPALSDFSIDVMPAGCEGDSYAGALAAIDWADLYERRNGFLLMEELRAQWAQAGYDYVFIDSRTGHTDSGGICTRQLPDAVVLVFFPNDQNLLGLRQVVRSIREGGARAKPIDLLFVASRVPKLDDEHGYLRDKLGAFQDAFGYHTDDLVTLHQYDSLALLDQQLFVLTRQQTGLASQYADLADQIAQLNDEDDQGAYAFIRAQHTRLSKSRGSESGLTPSLEDNFRVQERLDRIAELHRDNSQIQFMLARYYYRLRDLSHAATAIDLAVSALGLPQEKRLHGTSVPGQVHGLRIRIFSEMDRSIESTESAVAILDDIDAPDTNVLDALLLVASVDPALLPTVGNLPALSSADPERLMTVAVRLSSSNAATELAAEIAERAIEAATDIDQFTDLAKVQSQLVLVAGGRFRTAVKIGERLLARDPLNLPAVFNTAVAAWGRDGEPEVERFALAIKLFPTDEVMDVNAVQCLALAKTIVGDIDGARATIGEAHTALRLTRGLNFSCWTYTNVSATEFAEHLNAMKRFADGDGPGPAVLGAAAS